MIHLTKIFFGFTFFYIHERIKDKKYFWTGNIVDHMYSFRTMRFHKDNQFFLWINQGSRKESVDPCNRSMVYSKCPILSCFFSYLWYNIFKRLGDAMQIDINNLSFAYGRKLVINNLSFSINPGNFLVVRGKNGTGKSTLIKCLLGLNPVQTGTIFFDHDDINTNKNWTKIGYISQSIDHFNYEFPITVNEVLTNTKLRKVKENRKLKLLDQMGILEILNENINSLSGGQLQRVFIVKAMLNFPKLLILDEPTASIDKKNVEYFYQTVNALNSEGTTVILITHDDYLDCYNYSHVLQMNTDLTYNFRKRGQTELMEVR